jgi:hypothetical protein
VGAGADADGLTEEERLHWRRRAREWLPRVYEACLRRLVAGDPDYTRKEIKQYLDGWQTRWDMASVRTKSVLDGLPAGEREFWMSFWAELREKVSELRGK